MTMGGAPASRRRVAIIGAPMGFGAGKIGSELGVDAMRLSPMRGKVLGEHLADLGYQVVDKGDIDVVRPQYVAQADENPKYLHEAARTCSNLAVAVKDTLAENATPIVLGGDHTVAVGSFSGAASHFRNLGQELGLIWFDAHADINTPLTSHTGNIHGMPLAAILGDGAEELVGIEGFAPKLSPKYFAHVGARDLDMGERERIRGLGIHDHFFTMSEIDKRGMLACVNDAIAIAARAPAGYAVTFDVDMIDPRFAPGSGTLVRGGATYREAHLALEVIAEDGRMRSFEIVEVNPLIDQSNITVELAIELVLSAFGKTIL